MPMHWSSVPPAGAATAILLRMAGWRVILVEKSTYPRQKVCGECLSAASLALLDQLGVGAAVRDRAGAELHRVGWMSGNSILIADLPPCTDGPYRYGRALGRDHLDAILVKRAIELGVILVQPGKVRSVRGELGDFECDIIMGPQDCAEPGRSQASVIRRVPIVVDAHGSWEKGLKTVRGLHPACHAVGPTSSASKRVLLTQPYRRAYCLCFRFGADMGV